MLITTKQVPATDTRGTRLRATSRGLQRTVAYDYALSPLDNHANAAAALLSEAFDLWADEITLVSREETERGYRFRVDTTI